jgi:hypothetical protein
MVPGELPKFARAAHCVSQDHYSSHLDLLHHEQGVGEAAEGDVHQLLVPGGVVGDASEPGPAALSEDQQLHQPDNAEDDNNATTTPPKDYGDALGVIIVVVNQGPHPELAGHAFQPLVRLALLVPPKLLQPDSLLDDHKLGVGAVDDDGKPCPTTCRACSPGSTQASPARQPAG